MRATAINFSGEPASLTSFAQVCARAPQLATKSSVLWFCVFFYLVAPYSVRHSREELAQYLRTDKSEGGSGAWMHRELARLGLQHRAEARQSRQNAPSKKE